MMAGDRMGRKVVVVAGEGGRRQGGDKGGVAPGVTDAGPDKHNRIYFPYAP